jgi:Family of unknown function (DUF5335)
MTVSTASAAREGNRLEPPEWADYFNRLTTRIEEGLDLEATVEVVGDQGAGTEASWLPLLNITYEKHGGDVAIGLGGRGERYPAVLWHYVERPKLVWVHEHDGIPGAIAFEDEEGTLTLLRIRPAGS